MNPVYVTGNENKARLFNKMVGMDLEHVGVDIEEIQSLDLREVVEHKAKAAFRELQKPVVVEDTQLIFHALGRLPGPFIKWFLEDLGNDGVCRILNSFDDRSATAGSAIAFYDGKKLKIFESSLSGSIADSPRGDSGFGWNVIFVPDGSKKTFGEMREPEFEKYYKLVKPFDRLSQFLRKT